ncbi:hypothetical protein RFI_11176 [Reticulomyxa filosa]|uniref:Uncharacterized protein n=1 Tax=Reticulomyxa filosa TaxID=46433 RepID=X6NKS2_RETFI|nr:hypothetical protein RFI_11176 [Reticulomyxa filosa]|eukprot:ETO25962.1 hypothetical protein RFI_11176 [Reticulomyxa filosa]
MICDVKMPLDHAYRKGNTNNSNNNSNNNNNNGNEYDYKQQYKQNRHEFNFEIPVSSFANASDSKATSTVQRTLVFAESQDYVLTVFIAEVGTGSKVQLEFLSLRYTFTPPETMLRKSNRESVPTNNSSGLNDMVNHGKSLQPMVTTKPSELDRDIRSAQVHLPTTLLPTQTTQMQLQDQLQSGMNQFTPNSVRMFTIKPQTISVSTPSHSSQSTNTPAFQSVGTPSVEPGMSATKTATTPVTTGTNSASVRQFPLPTIMVGRGIAVNNNMTPQRNPQKQYGSNAMWAHGIVNSPASSCLPSPYPSTVGESPAHPPITHFSLSYIS